MRGNTKTNKLQRILLPVDAPDLMIDRTAQMTTMRWISPKIYLSTSLICSAAQKNGNKKGT